MLAIEFSRFPMKLISFGRFLIKFISFRRFSMKFSNKVTGTKVKACMICWGVIFLTWTCSKGQDEEKLSNFPDSPPIMCGIYRIRHLLSSFPPLHAQYSSRIYNNTIYSSLSLIMNINWRNGITYKVKEKAKGMLIIIQTWRIHKKKIVFKKKIKYNSIDFILLINALCV